LPGQVAPQEVHEHVSQGLAEAATHINLCWEIRDILVRIQMWIRSSDADPDL
jgi:hypothetical protein